MTDKDKEEIIQIIHSEIQKLIKRIKELEEFTTPVSPDNAIGRVSRMDAINNKSVFDASLRNTNERMEKLKLILKYVHEPDFGICTKCRQSISLERLKIRPEIRLCANCLKNKL